MKRDGDGDAQGPCEKRTRERHTKRQSACHNAMQRDKRKAEQLRKYMYIDMRKRKQEPWKTVKVAYF